MRSQHDRDPDPPGIVTFNRPSIRGAGGVSSLDRATCRCADRTSVYSAPKPLHLAWGRVVTDSPAQPAQGETRP